MIRKHIILIFLLSTIFQLNISSCEEKKSSGQNSQTDMSYTSEQEYLFDVFKTRRSVRTFKSTPISKEHILKILDIARTAPTAGNQQPWKFLVIQDRKKLNLLKEEIISSMLERIKKELDDEELKERRIRYNESYDQYISAPIYIVVLVDSRSKYSDFNTYDGSLAAGYLFIAARALGYGSVFFTGTFPSKIVKKVFNIPEHYEVICTTPIGVPVSWPETPSKKPLNEFVVFESFN